MVEEGVGCFGNMYIRHVNIRWLLGYEKVFGF
jgi:hypothetical protein